MVRLFTLLLVAFAFTAQAAGTKYLIECKADKDPEKNPRYKIHRYSTEASGKVAQELEIEKLVTGRDTVKMSPTIGMSVNDGVFLMDEKKEVLSYTLVERAPNESFTGLIHYSASEGVKTFVIKLTGMQTEKVHTDYTCKKIR